MKKLILLASIALISFNAHAQKLSDDNIPASVTDAFKSRFSIAEKTSWELDYDNYMASFVVGNADFSATFDKDGKWLKTESFIKPSALPKTVKDFVAKKFAGYKADDTEKVETPDKGIAYQMTIAKDELVYDITVSDKGELLKHELKSEDKDVKKSGSKK